MLTRKLFEEVLMVPAKKGANKLYIVSGYATAAMAFHHLEALKEKGHKIKIELIIGMALLDGLSESNHKGFCELKQKEYPGSFSCSYLTEMPPVHSKTYSWFKDDRPLSGFIGSANYTQVAFGKRQREAMVATDAEKGYEYFRELEKQTLYCDHIDAENMVQIYNDKTYERIKREKTIIEQQEALKKRAVPKKLLGLPFVQITLLARNGSLPQRSGLNWGQRPELHREPNQAYIRVPSSIGATEYFPPRSIHFTVLTDDGKILICTRAQDKGKGIHTPHNNSLIGEYFRNRLGVANGAPVTLNDLRKYGRTDVDFYKIDDETYYLDFSVNRNG